MPLAATLAHGESRGRPLARSRVVTALVVGAASVALAATVATAAFTAYVARVVIVPPKRRVENTRVLGSTAETVTLQSTDDSRTPGRYGFWFDGDRGYARVGEIVSRTATTVTRQLLSVEFGDLRASRRGRISGAFYLHPSELDVPVEDVEVATQVGSAPAWLVPAARSSDRWAILVHGRGVTRTEPIRAVPVFREAGYTSLLVSYRNDGVAPSSDDGRYALGSTEWRDVEAAMAFAVSRGAKHIVLMGWSMGGATSLQASFLSPHRALLRGLALESPVIDWRHVLNFQAKQQRVPHFVRTGALALLGTRWGGPFTGQSQPIDLNSLDLLERANELNVPTLLMHSAGDLSVPVSASRELARLRPDRVRYEEFADALHAKLWNRDSERFERVIAAWLGSLDLRAATGRTARSLRRTATGASSLRAR